jgi:hypothetical protein
VEQSLHSLRRVRNAFAHSTGVVRLADPPYRETVCGRAWSMPAAIRCGNPCK